MEIEKFNALMRETDKLHQRNELAKTIGKDYFEPGMMEYPEQWDGSFDEVTGKLQLRFESRGTKYEGRTEQIEKVKTGDEILIVREPENPFNSNNFRLLTKKENSIGNMPAELCNVIAPLYDDGSLEIRSARVSYVEPVSARSRYALKAILFVEAEIYISAKG